MVAVKIQCPCGQKFAFDVQPVSGRMPAPIACPVCGADGTEAANQLIAQSIATQPKPTAIPATRLAPATAPAIPTPPALPATPMAPRPVAFAAPRSSSNRGKIGGQVGGFVGLLAVIAFPTGIGILGAAFIGGFFGGAAGATGYSVGSFIDALGEKPPSVEGLPNKTGLAVASLILGLLALGAWFLPIIGLPVSVAGFWLGRKASWSKSRGLAMAGMILSLIGLILSLINAYIGAWIAVHAFKARHGH